MLYGTIITMYSQYRKLKIKAVALRRKGRTYGEIRKIVGSPIQKSTLSYWFKNIILSEKSQKKLNQAIDKNIKKAQDKALATNKKKREDYVQTVRDRVVYFPKMLKDKNIAKIALAMLYLGEGSKTRKGSLTLGNSSPMVIRLFLHLLRFCYSIDESKFRCTVQCRADQNIDKLEKFWSSLTKISFSQFYKAQIDPRTIGKPSKNLDYKGVCRIDYFSGDIFMELIQIAEVIFEGL